MKLLIVRHGDPDYSIDSLTPTGWAEAECLVPRMQKLDVKAFYVSPLGRARDTAAATLKALGREATVKPWLREFACSMPKPWLDHETCIWDWLPEDWTAEPKYYDKDHWFDTPEMRKAGAEAEYRWVCQGLDELLAEHGYRRKDNYYLAERPNEDTIVFFCHFGLECVLLSHLLGVSPMVLWHGTAAAPTSVTTVNTEERREGKANWRVAAFGDISHLYVANREPSFSCRFRECYYRDDQRLD